MKKSLIFTFFLCNVFFCVIFFVKNTKTKNNKEDAAKYELWNILISDLILSPHKQDFCLYPFIDVYQCSSSR